MTNWNEIREEYLRGGITQSQLAQRHGVPVGSLRRRAAAEGWKTMRKTREGGLQEDAAAVSSRTARQLALTDRMLELLGNALEAEEQLYLHVEFAKYTSASELVCEKLNAFNEERAARIVRLMGELFEQQRIILGIHDYKDQLAADKLAQDERLTLNKLEQQTTLAERKLELELLKLEGGTGGTDLTADGFLAALGMTGDEPVYVQP